MFKPRLDFENVESFLASFYGEIIPRFDFDSFLLFYVGEIKPKLDFLVFLLFCIGEKTLPFVGSITEP
jgi:hypothetical protein